MVNIHRFRRLIGAAAHLCQVEADLVAAGYPDLVQKLDDIRCTIDLEICYLEDGSDLSQPL
jgi:hypothetical protein